MDVKSQHEQAHEDAVKSHASELSWVSDQVVVIPNVQGDELLEEPSSSVLEKVVEVGGNSLIFLRILLHLGLNHRVLHFLILDLELFDVQIVVAEFRGLSQFEQEVSRVLVSAKHAA